MASKTSTEWAKYSPAAVVISLASRERMLIELFRARRAQSVTTFKSSMKLQALRWEPTRLVALPVMSSTSGTSIGHHLRLAKQNYATLQSENIVPVYSSTLKRASLWSAPAWRRFGPSRLVAAMAHINSASDCGVKPPNTKAVTGLRTPKRGTFGNETRPSPQTA